MRADGIVDFFPVPQLAIELLHFQRAGRDLVELLGVGAVGAFDGAVEFGRARGKDEQVHKTGHRASVVNSNGMARTSRPAWEGR